MNITDWVIERATAQPDHPAIVHGASVWRFAELMDRSEAIATALRPLVHGAAPRVALFHANGPEYIALALAVLRIGACFVPVPSELAMPERLQLLISTAPQLVITAGPHAWLPGEAASIRAGGIDFQWTRFAARPRFPEDRLAALNPAFVRFSSGTTGGSKGVVISHESLLARVRSANRRLRIGPTDRVLWTLPMAHHFAVSIMLYLMEGATTVLEDSHLAADLLGSATASGASVLYGSPFHLALLAAEDSGRDWPSLRLAVGTASALPAKTSLAFEQRYGQAPQQGLGIIEVGLPLLNDADPAGRRESVGKPDDFELSLRDESGRAVAPGELGQLWLRGPGLFDAYLEPWIERREMDEQDWFATGDLATRDSDGFVFLRGRRNAVINFGGMKFFPEDVEAVLNEHPAVLESRVHGEPHERWGAVAIAEIVALDPAHPPASPVLARHCRERLAAYKIPARFVSVPAIAKTANGKIRR